MSRSMGLSAEIEAYVRDANRPEHPALARCREETQANAEIPAMQISPEQAAFMALTARLIDAKTYIEVGVFTGYSALAMALTLRDMHADAAEVVACDISEDFLKTARGYWDEAGVTDLIDTRIGPAAESLAALSAGSADIMFVDADKTGYPAYFEEAARLLRPGGVVLFDNVLWSGDVANEGRDDPDTEALRDVARLAKADERFDIAFTTIGDGLLLCRKRDRPA